MQFAECNEGAFRIYVGALESPKGDGFTAALIVKPRQSAGLAAQDAWAYRDDNLACGHRWPSAEAALAYALARGRDVVRRRAPEQVPPQVVS
jgi:hypothetical protein